MNNEIVDAILNYTHAASKIALSEQQNLSVQLKPDASYVTDIDLRLSELSFRMLASVVPERNIITEEHLENLGALTDELNPDSDEIVAFVDPIDGTRNYFHGIPLYGISVGVFRNRKPWLGITVFPGLSETFYSDGHSAYLVTGSDGSERVALKEPTQDLNTNSVLLLANSFMRKFQWNYDVCTPLVTACVSLNACWPVIGRGIGTVLSDHIWDFAGGWPILSTLGFELRGVDSGRKIEGYSADDYDPESHFLKEALIVSRPEHFARLQTGIRHSG